MNQTYQVHRISTEAGILEELLKEQAAQKYLLDHIVAVGFDNVHLVVITKLDATHIPARPEGQQTLEKAPVRYHSGK